MDFGCISDGGSIDLLCKMKIFDISHGKHVLVTEPNGIPFVYTGLLEFGHEAYTLLDAELVRQFPEPHVKASQFTRVMHHDPPSWDKLHDLIDVCSGFGGMAQGAHAAGFFVKVAVDHNPKMLSLFQTQFNCDVVLGDAGAHEVMYNTWHASRGAACMSAGFACQPYSRLGDGRGKDDERSSCLSKVLTMAFFLRVHVLVLECVSPAAQNDFVRNELAHFIHATGFTCSQCELKLDMVWPSRRSRAWWVLTSPLVGPVNLQSWPKFDDVTQVQHVIPCVSSWDPRDELALSLNHDESIAFGLADGTFTRFLLDAKGVAPCALHSWGNQLTACPCGCRSHGLSKHRLATKGLFGVLIRSAPDKQGFTCIRHLHPSEGLALNVMDPVIDFGLDVRLTLCAIGQLASPVQALWIFGSLASNLDNRQFGQVLFSPEAQIQAFRSWILMRCRQVWQPEKEPVVNTKTVSLMGFWNEFASLSLPELMYLPKWDELQGCSLSLAAILDAIIRDQQIQIPKSPGSREDTMGCQVDDQIQNDDAITPWFDGPETTSPMKVECQPDICQAFFPDCDQVPVRCAISQGSQVGQLIAAQEKLVGSIGPVTVVSAIGTDLTHSHELDLGSTLMVRAQAQSGSESSAACVGPDPKCHVPVVMPFTSALMPLAGQPTNTKGSAPCWECGPLPKLPVQGPFEALNQEIAHPTPSILSDFPMPEAADVRVETQCDAQVKEHCRPTLIEPTATWSQPIIDPNPAPLPNLIALPAQTESIRSAGVSDVPERLACTGVDAAHSCISAAPLLALQSEQFVALTPPCINCFDHLDALRNQVVLSGDRLEILNKQGDTWADDEIRFHLLSLQQKVFTSPAPLKPGVAVPLMIDPLLCASWLRNQGSMCVQWCRSHPEVAAAGVQVIACFRVGTHWIPVWFVPMKDHVHITTWDAQANSHADLEPLLERMGYAFGFRSVMINRQQRIFFHSSLCGSLAIAFLHHALFDTMLPTNHDEAAFLQARLKRQFFDQVQSQQASVRPWVWGNGDEEECDQVGETASSEPAGSADETSLCPAVSGAPCEETSLQVDLSRYEIDFPPTCIGLGREGGFAHRCITAEERIQLIISKGQAMADDEIRFHAIEFLQGDSVAVGMNDEGASGFAFLDPLLFSTWDSVGKNMCIHWCQHHPQIKEANHQIVSAINFDDHWMPVWITAHRDVLQVHVVDNFHGMFPMLDDIGNTLAVHLGFSEVVYHWIPVGFPQDEMCGALTIAFLGHIIAKEPLPQTQRELQDLHVNLRAAFVEAVYTSACCRCPVVWGRGPGPLCRELASELLKHGVPEAEAENRAAQAIRAIGSDQVQQALKHKQPWRQLKSLANNVRFQFLHPAELAEVVAANRGKQVGKKTKGNSNVRISRMPPAVDLDPQKIKMMDGIFRADQRVVPQILPQQIGPVASGVVLMTLADAEPYLRAGAQVSQEPLALAICQAPDVVIETTLPHKSVTIPCRCLADNEPILVETVLVQLGSGFVDKVSGQTKVELESLDVVTIKMISFKDELPIDWESFSAAPIKHLVSQFPILRRCETQGCHCNHWHNSDNLPIRDPILDVWRRQFLRNGFKPVPALQADFFSVCI